MEISHVFVVWLWTQVIRICHLVYKKMNAIACQTLGTIVFGILVPRASEIYTEKVLAENQGLGGGGHMSIVNFALLKD